MEDKHTPATAKKGLKLWVKVVINLAAMFVVGMFVFWLATLWLDVWTDHGHFLTVPQVKGLQYSAAVQKLEDEGFTVELSDSIYDTTTRPGTVVDQNPKMGTKVKDGRLVYLTVNAFSPRMVTIPMLDDTSLRQARSALQGVGINNIKVVTVESEFKDLVLAVKRNGVRLLSGARVPVNAEIVLEVGSGATAASDSVDADMDAVDHLDLF